MTWPLSQDYNEAIQSPAASFADPDLRAGTPATNALGIPMPRSGNFADVYEMQGPNGSRWAVKCFTRQVVGLRERYQEISRCLGAAGLPFTIDFTFLEEGIRVHGRWYPILKMQWVEGLTFNEFVRQHLDKPAMMDALFQIWGRMAQRLRGSGIAHADLQHGNVLWVPGSTANAVAVKLIDYDGMFVPSLAGKPSGEVGHPCYQHPQRLREATYNSEVDRFPLLLIATSLRSLRMGGRALWERYDNGDNLLFRESDLNEPDSSKLLRELEGVGDPKTKVLVGAVRQALQAPLEKAPLLEELLPELGPAAPAARSTRPAQVTPAAAVTKPPASRPAAAAVRTTARDGANDAFAFDDGDEQAEGASARYRRKTSGGVPGWIWACGAGGVGLLVLLVGLGIWGLSGGSSRPQPPDGSGSNPRAQGPGRDKDLVEKPPREKPGDPPRERPKDPPRDLPALNPAVRQAYKNRSGEWSIEGDELVQSSLVAECQLVFGDFTWKDYDFTCEAKKVEGNSEFALSYCVTSESCSLFNLGAFNNTRDYTSFCERGNFAIREQRNNSLEKDRWYKLKVELRGGHRRLFLGDELVFEYDDPRSTQGAVGFRTWGIAARFRKIRVTDPGGQVLFHGLPALPAQAGQWPPATDKPSESELYCLREHGAPVTDVIFSRDGRLIVSSSNGETLRGLANGGATFCCDPASVILFQDARTGKKVGSSQVLSQMDLNRAFTRLAPSPRDPGFLCSRNVPIGDPSGRVHYWANTQQNVWVSSKLPNEIPGINNPMRKQVGSADLGFTPDGRKALALSLEGDLQEWDVSEKKLVRVLEGGQKGTSCGALAPNGKFALLGKWNQPFIEIDLESGKETGRWKENAGPASLAVAPDSTRVLEGTVFGEVRLWDVAGGKMVHVFRGHKKSVKAVAFSPDGRRALSGSDDGAVRLWDLEERKELAVFTGHTAPVRAVAFSLDGSRAASGSEDYTVRLWRLPGVTATPPTPPTPLVEEKGFVPLFNGKDLTGWKPHPKQPGTWRVEEGVLVGSGPADGYLFSNRGDYKDFHLRVEARINDTGNSGVFFRTSYDLVGGRTPRGYEAEINSGSAPYTGSLWVPDPEGAPGAVVPVRESLAPAGQWFTLEVVAAGNHIILEVNGRTTADYTDAKRRFSSGHIALQLYARQRTVVEFRKIEIKESGMEPGETPPTEGVEKIANLPDRFQKEIEKALAEYARVCKATDKNMLRLFDVEIEKVRKSANLKLEEKQKLVESLGVEKATFAKYSTLPFSPRMREPALLYIQKISLAERPVTLVFAKAADHFVKARDEAGVTQVVALKKKLGRKVLGVWECTLRDIDAGWRWTLYSDFTAEAAPPASGTFHTLIQSMTATWALDKEKMTTLTRGPGEPPGGWKDTCTFAADGQSYTGRNQIGSGHKAKRADPVK
jgi:WD40 repeat protein